MVEIPRLPCPVARAAVTLTPNQVMDVKTANPVNIQRLEPTNVASVLPGHPALPRPLSVRPVPLENLHQILGPPVHHVILARTVDRQQFTASHALPEHLRQLLVQLVVSHALLEHSVYLGPPPVQDAKLGLFQLKVLLHVLIALLDILAPAGLLPVRAALLVAFPIPLAQPAALCVLPARSAQHSQPLLAIPVVLVLALRITIPQAVMPVQQVPMDPTLA